MGVGRQRVAVMGVLASKGTCTCDQKVTKLRNKQEMDLTAEFGEETVAQWEKEKADGDKPTHNEDNGTNQGTRANINVKQGYYGQGT